MREKVIPAAIIAVGLIVGGFLAGGRYAIVPGDANTVTRIDRYTGEVSMCIIGAGLTSCGWTIPPRAPQNSN